jgi:hypothetical protein
MGNPEDSPGPEPEEARFFRPRVNNLRQPPGLLAPGEVSPDGEASPGREEALMTSPGVKHPVKYRKMVIPCILMFDSTEHQR